MSKSTVVLVRKPDRREQLIREIAEVWSRSPRLRLTTGDVERRWQLESSTCRQLLDALVDRHVLTRAEDGTFVTA